jgi:hypothetical protein
MSAFDPSVFDPATFDTGAGTVAGVASLSAPTLTMGEPVVSASGSQTIAAVIGTIAAIAPALTLGNPLASGTGAQTVAAVAGNGTATAPVLSLAAPVASGAGALGVPQVTGTCAATAPALTLGTPIAAAVVAYSEGGAIYPLITVSAERKQTTWPAEPKQTIYAAQRKRVTYPAWPNGVRRMITLDTKGAAEILYIRVTTDNWPMVADDNAVTDYTVTVTSGDLVATKLSMDDGAMMFSISGGTPGTNATIALLATLADGQKPDQVFGVFVR